MNNFQSKGLSHGNTIKNYIPRSTVIHEYCFMLGALSALDSSFQLSYPPGLFGRIRYRKYSNKHPGA